jgi:hypothetical protein
MKKSGGILHNLGAIVLGTIAVLAFVLTSLSIWIHQTVLVTDRFVGIVTDVTSEPQVIDSVSTRLSVQVVDRLQVESRLENLLPDVLDRLAPRIADALRDRLADASINLLSGEQFQEGWRTVLTTLHSDLVAVMRGETENVTISDNTLTIDLLGIAGKLIEQLQADGVIPAEVSLPDFNVIDNREALIAELSSRLQAQIPPDFGQVQVANVTGLQQLSTLIQQFDTAILVMVVITLVAIVLTFVWAHRRWRALFVMALFVEILLALMLVAVVVAQGTATDAMAQPEGRVMAAAFVNRVGQSLFSWLAWTAVFVAIFAAIVAVIGAFRTVRDY